MLSLLTSVVSLWFLKHWFSSFLVISIPVMSCLGILGGVESVACSLVRWQIWCSRLMHPAIGRRNLLWIWWLFNSATGEERWWFQDHIRLPVPFCSDVIQSRPVFQVWSVHKCYNPLLYMPHLSFNTTNYLTLFFTNKSACHWFQIT